MHDTRLTHCRIQTEISIKSDIFFFSADETRQTMNSVFAFVLRKSRHSRAIVNTRRMIYSVLISMYAKRCTLFQRVSGNFGKFDEFV